MVSSDHTLRNTIKPRCATKGPMIFLQNFRVSELSDWCKIWDNNIWLYMVIFWCLIMKSVTKAICCTLRCGQTIPFSIWFLNNSASAAQVSRLAKCSNSPGKEKSDGKLDGKSYPVTTPLYKLAMKICGENTWVCIISNLEH
jgi:hypothetical protein